jgi:hypothetical protein
MLLTVYICSCNNKSMPFRLINPISFLLHSPTPWHRVFHEKIIVNRLIKKWSCFNETRNFVITFIDCCYWSQSWTRLLQSGPNRLSLHPSYIIVLLPIGPDCLFFWGFAVVLLRVFLNSSLYLICCIPWPISFIIEEMWILTLVIS